jgi:RNA methyltransferase, TrmH family
MITIQKLARLPDATRRRKIVRLLESWERAQHVPEPGYLAGLVRIIHADGELPEPVRLAAGELCVAAPEDRLRAVNELRHRLMHHLQIAPGDWDLLPPAGFAASGPTDPQSSRTPPLARAEVYLESIRSPFNLGGVIRTAAAFGIAAVGMSDDCPPIDHPRVRRSAMGAAEHIELSREPLGGFVDRFGGPCIALELGGRPYDRFDFPDSGVLLLGSEELGLSPEALSRADIRVTIPLYGMKASLNVVVACGIALAGWQKSLMRPDRPPG